MADLATLQTRLQEAEEAYHRLLTGSQVEEVQHGDMRQRFTNSVTAMQTLASYIGQLKTEIAQLGGSSGQPRRGIVVDL